MENETRRTTILLTTHDMEDMRALCSRVMVLGHGQLLYDGTLTNLLTSFEGYTLSTGVLSAEMNKGIVRRSERRRYMANYPAKRRRLVRNHAAGDGGRENARNGD